MVAGGGGGSSAFCGYPSVAGSGHAGGLVGTGSSGGGYGSISRGGTQTAAGGGSSSYWFTSGSFGKGANTGGSCGAGGGGGYYGGGAAQTETGGGGSSFISGHPGCNAINENGIHTGQPIHFSGIFFTETEMAGGNELMPNPNGGTMIGNNGNGVVRITRIN